MISLLIILLQISLSTFQVLHYKESVGKITILLKNLARSNVNSSQNLVFQFKCHGQFDFSFTIKDQDNPRIQVFRQSPFVIDYMQNFTFPIQSSMINFYYTQNPFNFRLTRKDNQEVIFDTSNGNFIFDQHYIEISNTINTKNIFGLGQRNSDFKLKKGNWTIFNKDKGMFIDQGWGNGNTYGNYPIVLFRLPSRSLNLIQLRNNYPMTVYVEDYAQSSYKISYKVVGGVFDFRILIDDLTNTNTDIIDRFHSLFAKSKLIPPFWSMGFHLSKYGYPNSKKLLQVIDKMQQNQLPLDTLWSDIDYMDKYQDFTMDKTNYPLDEMSILTGKKHWVPILDAGIAKGQNQAYQKGQQMGVFMVTAQGNEVSGRVWPGDTTFVDFFRNNAGEYWKYFLNQLYQQVKFSGIWIDMNEYSNFCDGNCIRSNSTTGFDYSKDLPFNPAFGQTVQSHGLSFNSTILYQNKKYEYAATHNYLCHLQAKYTNQFLSSKNMMPFIISRATTIGSSQYLFHWTGDNYASFQFLKISLGQICLFNFWGIQMVGADICGFAGDTNQDLCSRWFQASTFYPFARDHNDINSIDQQPYSLGPTVLKTAQLSLYLRYSLLKQYYTYFVVHEGKGAIFRPLFLDFNNDKCFYDQFIDTQFIIDKALMFAPILQANQKDRSVYFPQVNWYDYQTGKVYPIQTTVRITNDYNQTVPLFIRQGHLIFSQPNIVLQTSQLTSDFTLIGAMKFDQKRSSQKSKVYFANGKILSINNYSDEAKVKNCLRQHCVYLAELIYEIGAAQKKLSLNVNTEGSLIQTISISKAKVYTLDAGILDLSFNTIKIKESKTYNIPISNHQKNHIFKQQ